MADVERARRLREARKKAGYPSATAAADSLGAKYSTYVAHENASRAFDNDLAQIYSRKFKVRLDWLLTGRGEQEAEFFLPIELEQKLLRKSEATLPKVFEAIGNLIDAFPDEQENPSGSNSTGSPKKPRRRTDDGDPIHFAKTPPSPKKQAGKRLQSGGGGFMGKQKP